MLLPAMQRRLLERLVALAASVIGSQVPLAAVTLETLGLLLEILGEVPPETAQLLQVPLTQKLTCQHSLLRMQVSFCKCWISVGSLRTSPAASQGADMCSVVAVRGFCMGHKGPAPATDAVCTA